ncbi:MAG: SIS domain-containing protein [Alphaproteobacteria bacterium]|nr:SIS domain-containing protein [Alphaproteobacteria bacterium]
MAREIADIPGAATRLLERGDALASIAARIERFQPRRLMFCGRGSSSHIGVYLRYLAEVRLGIAASAAAPSVLTAYGARPEMRDLLFVVISQSGQSTDLVAMSQAAREGGALTLAIVNAEGSPVAQACELVAGIGAGPEVAVAATKTVVLSMIAGALLFSRWAHDAALAAALYRLPLRLAAAHACEWAAWSKALEGASAAFVAGRGYSQGPVKEVGLKLLETLRMPALAFSAAELRHGPRAAIGSATPVLVLRQHDATAPMVDVLARDLLATGENVFVAGGPMGTLPWIADDDPVCDPVAMLVPAYRAIEAAARAKGFDPDNPPHLSKITRTL